jgi:dephospho-CoA kinase
MLQSKGAYLIDHDVLAHEAQEPNRTAWKEIVARFGEEILNADRTINRQRLGAIVFQNEEKRRTLMDIVHPVVFAEWKKRLNKIAEDDPLAIVVSDVPLLFEKGWQNVVDVVVLVYTSRDTQIQRLMARNGYSRQEAESRLTSQMPIDEKALLADFIINNNGPLDQVQSEIDRVWDELLKIEKTKRLQNVLFRSKGK